MTGPIRNHVPKYLGATCCLIDTFTLIVQVIIISKYNSENIYGQEFPRTF